MLWSIRKVLSTAPLYSTLQPLLKPKLETPPDFKPPTSMGPGKWFKYMANTVGLAPIPKDADFKFGDVPEGVRVLGGTYVLDGDEVVFSHQDAVPGATPEISAVLAAAGM